MKYVSVRPLFCPNALFLKPLKRVSTVHTRISGLYTKTCRASLILVRINQSGGTFRGTHFELFILPSPILASVNVYSFRTSRFHGCEMIPTGQLGYDTTQSGTLAPSSWRNTLPHSFP